MSEVAVKAAARATQRVRQATAERDALIASAAAHGAGNRELARATGLSHTAIAKIVARTTLVPVNAEDLP